MKRAKPILLLLLVFIAGAFTGVVATRAAVRSFVRKAILNPEFLRQTSERDLTRKLSLDPDQQAKVHAILLHTQEDLHGLRNEFLPRLGTTIERTNTAISAVLTAEQQKKFERIRAENREFWAPR